MMVMETWILTFAEMFSRSSLASARTAPMLKLFQALRIMRLARLLRLLRVMPELLVLIRAMGAAFRSVFVISILLGFIIFVFAVIFTQLTKGNPMHDLYFSSVLVSMGNLLMEGTLPDHAHLVMALTEESQEWALLLMVFIFLAPMTVMGMWIGILVEVVQVTTEVEKETLTVSLVTTKLREVLEEEKEENDDDCDVLEGFLSRDRVQELITRVDVVHLLTSVGVDMIGLTEYLDFLFNDDKEIHVGSFLELVLQLRGANKATVSDIVELRKFIWTSHTERSSEMEKVEDKLDGITDRWTVLEESLRAMTVGLLSLVDQSVT